MRLALNEARKALQLQEVPIGAVVVADGAVVGRAVRHRRTVHHVRRSHRLGAGGPRGVGRRRPEEGLQTLFGDGVPS